MRSIIPKILRSKRNDRGSSDEEVSEADDSDNSNNNNNIAARRKAFAESPPVMSRSFLESQGSSGTAGMDVPNFDRVMAAMTEFEDYRIFVATWNVGGKTPDNGLNLEEFLKVEGSSDIYVLGFQEIVPLNAGNVLVIEDNEPAAKWLGLISQALNKSVHDSSTCASSDSSPTSRSGLNYTNKLKETRSPTHLAFFQKPSLKVLSRSLRVNSSLLKSCNCSLDDIAKTQKQRPKVFSGPLCVEHTRLVEETPSSPCSSNHLSYGLVASKQMVGVFLSVWARTELIQHIAHLRVDTIGTGIMGCLGNKGCISVSMSLHQTSFCFICSHLASGEKEGDELKRNADVAEILKNIQFQNICRKNPSSRAPEKIIGHDRIIWFGDLNYRIALSYEETKALLVDNDWNRLLEKDQLNIEKEAGRVFNGWKEGNILFAPTYKYTQNSDSYAGETVKSKKKRRTPAWCDRILWHGNGIDQVAYIRGESRFSDHRPVCSVFTVKVESRGSIKPTRGFRKGYSSCAGGRRIVEFEDCVHQRRSLYEF